MVKCVGEAIGLLAVSHKYCLVSKTKGQISVIIEAEDLLR